jgi:hypothetical protein
MLGGNLGELIYNDNGIVVKCGKKLLILDA